MNHDPWKKIDVKMTLYAHEYAIAEELAELVNFPSTDEYVEHFVRSTLLEVGDNEEVPYLPARAHRKRTEEILGKERRCVEDAE